MTAPAKNNNILTLSIASILGGVIGYAVGLVWLTPGILIPIGVVVGLAVGLAFVSRNKKS